MNGGLPFIANARALLLSFQQLDKNIGTFLRATSAVSSIDWYLVYIHHKLQRKLTLSW
jgi:hypothetical protein